MWNHADLSIEGNCESVVRERAGKRDWDSVSWDEGVGPVDKDSSLEAIGAVEMSKELKDGTTPAVVSSLPQTLL